METTFHFVKREREKKKEMQGVNLSGIVLVTISGNRSFFDILHKHLYEKKIRIYNELSFSPKLKSTCVLNFYLL